ncbi:MAG: hypothetical protein K9L59_18435 [Desulfobacterales bacterium]|nr:hypothetical protein [Desulfobacterales bacterium]MCF8080856.1 hypothetical protein [Desulfobacterales bacterium]
MTYLRKTVIVLLTAVLAVAGCAGMRESYRSSQFETRSFELVRAIRWGEYEMAVAFLDKEAEAPDPEIFQAVKISDYKTGAYQISEDAMRITQPVTFRYYRTDIYTERSTTVEMVWKYDTDRGDWFLLSGFPSF